MVKKHMRFSNEVEEVLKSAGWYSGRSKNELVDEAAHELSTKDNFKIFPAAMAILNEFIGLDIKVSGEGISTIRMPPIFEPTLALGESDNFEYFGSIINVRLYPLGEAADGYLYMACDEAGRIYVLMDIFCYLADDIDSALEKLILGIMPIRIA